MGVASPYRGFTLLDEEVGKLELKLDLQIPSLMLISQTELCSGEGGGGKGGRRKRQPHVMGSNQEEKGSKLISRDSKYKGPGCLLEKRRR